MLRFVLCCLLLSLPFGPARAADGDAARAAIQRLAPMQQLKGFRKSALPGYYEGVILGQVAYASADGRYVIRGQVDDAGNGVSLTEESMAERRIEALAAIGPDRRLSFAPARPSYRITVFTDVDCPYCKRLHAQIAEYNRLGIAIDYVFFPLGIHPGADRKSASVWCAADRKAAYDAAMNGHAPVSATCETPIVAMMKAGNEIGVNATPTAIGPDGRVIASTVLMTPSRLLAELKKSAESNTAIAQENSR
ncbi:MAG: DsbC family protein [Xanthomonadales bacterium]|nr:DsbC family protein [Xanthomonadales bacterium]